MRLRAKHSRGFTLMELLVVMAISIILMGLVLAPVIKSFQLTRRAQAMVDSQDAARMALQLISRELGQAMYVYDNSSRYVSVSETALPAGAILDTTQTPIMLPVAQPDHTIQWFPLPGGKIDFILPKLMLHCNNPSHGNAPRDYPRERVVGNYREYYSIRECPYCGSSDVDIRPKLPMEQDTTVVRYFLALRQNNVGEAISEDVPEDNRGWVSPWGKNVIDGTQNQVVLYRVEFNIGDDSLFPADETAAQRLSDPYFFYRKDSSGTDYRKNWMDIARVVGIGKYEDLVTATTDANDKITSIEPCITFRTASIENDTFSPAYTSDKKSEYPNAAASVYNASYGYWTPEARVDVFRGDYVEDASQGTDYYTETRGDELWVMKRVPDRSGYKDTQEFNISEYLRKGYVPADSGTTHLEMAYTIDTNRGTVNFALQPVRPSQASSGPVAVLVPADINRRFHEQYKDDRGGAIRSALLPTFDPSKSAQFIQNARMSPGSEKVIGPDMRPGSNYGRPVRYERVPLALGDPGINQYKVDYDQGWVLFSRDPGLDLPEGEGFSIQVYYLICFNRQDDVVRGDYLTKSLINIHMGMRMFDPDSGKPHPVDLSDSVKIRNALR